MNSNVLDLLSVTTDEQPISITLSPQKGRDSIRVIAKEAQAGNILYHNGGQKISTELLQRRHWNGVAPSLVVSGIGRSIRAKKITAEGLRTLGEGIQGVEIHDPKHLGSGLITVSPKEFYRGASILITEIERRTDQALCGFGDVWTSGRTCYRTRELQMLRWAVKRTGDEVITYVDLVPWSGYTEVLRTPKKTPAITEEEIANLLVESAKKELGVAK